MRAASCHLLLTGGTGYIGTELTRLALAQGCTVTLLGRTPPRRPLSERVRYVPYALGEPLAAEVFKTVNVVIHLAADTASGPNRLPEPAEIDAGLTLFATAAAQGCRCLFVSSQSARHDAAAAYGRIKWHIERAVLQDGGYVVRPGLVYGGARLAGLFGTLCGLVQRWPVLPDLRPRPQVQPLHVLDLCLALLQLACHPEALPGVYNLGAPQGIAFTDFLKALARYRVGTMRLFLPVPLIVVTVLARLHTLCPWLPDRHSERLLGLAALRPMATQASLQQLGLALRPLAVGLQRRTGPPRRVIAWEGRALLWYVSGRQPSPGSVKRYVRGVERRFGATPLSVPSVFLQFPRLLYLLDTNQRRPDLAGCYEVSQRLPLAVALAEASPTGARQFLQLHRQSGFAAWLSLLGIVLQEALVKAVQYGCTALLRLMCRLRSRP